MNNTIQASTTISHLAGRLSERGIKPHRTFHRAVGILRHRALCADLELIRAEALANRPKTWADFNSCSSKAD